MTQKPNVLSARRKKNKPKRSLKGTIGQEGGISRVWLELSQVTRRRRRRGTSREYIYDDAIEKLFAPRITLISGSPRNSVTITQRRQLSTNFAPRTIEIRHRNKYTCVANWIATRRWDRLSRNASHRSTLPLIVSRDKILAQFDRQGKRRRRA